MGRLAMKLLSDSRRRRKFIIWLEGLGARGAAGPGGAEGETEAAAAGRLRRLRPGPRRASPADSRGALGPCEPGCAGLRARERAGTGVGPWLAPPRAAELAPPPLAPRLRGT